MSDASGAKSDYDKTFSKAQVPRCCCFLNFILVFFFPGHLWPPSQFVRRGEELLHHGELLTVFSPI